MQFPCKVELNCHSRKCAWIQQQKQLEGALQPDILAYVMFSIVYFTYFNNLSDSKPTLFCVFSA